MRNKTERCSALFFKFVPGDTKEVLKARLEKVKENGIHNVIASYEEEGLKEGKFNERYFQTLPELAEACEEMDMTFWLEDYSPFPTGSANGAYKEEEYAAKNKLFLDERHMDFRGPCKNAVIRIDALQNVVYGNALRRFTKMDPAGRSRIGVVAYRICEHESEAFAPILEEESGVILDPYVKDGYLRWEIPDGYWRIFVLFTTYESSGRPFYMNLLDKESVALEIEKVHKPIYHCLKEYRGKSWNGFFYDEPEIGNAGGDGVFDFFMLPGRRTKEKTDCSVYPWSAEMEQEMGKREEAWIRKLPYLWYEAGQHKQKAGRLCEDEKLRFDYMDSVTALIRENYNGQVYRFCSEHGIHYIGHVLEDEGSHTRLGCGTGHYFRQQYYQDEAGIDMIAGQILPGRDGAASWYGVANADGEFYHYGLAKLASSEAHINPLKQNRSVCETFAMYGQQGMAERKFLIDHLLINGINRFLFGELPSYDAPIEYAAEFVNYTDRMCRLLRESKPVTKTAILYHAEAEWMAGKEVQGFQVPASVLAQNQISYDVVPADVFAFPKRYDTQWEDGLVINGNRYEALIIPSCHYLSTPVKAFVMYCEKSGFPVVFVDQLPKNLSIETEDSSVKVASLDHLAESVLKQIRQDIWIEIPKDPESKRWIRSEHVIEKGEEYILLHNEGWNQKIECHVYLHTNKRVVQEDPFSQIRWIPDQEKEDEEWTKLSLVLEAGEMTILFMTEEKESIQGMPNTELLMKGKTVDHTGTWTLELPDGRSVKGENGILPDPGSYLEPEFYGKLVYRTTWNLEKEEPPVLLSLGKVSDCCEVILNGTVLGKRLASPYLYDVRNVIRPGQNEMTIEIYTSAANRENPVRIFGVPLNSLTAYPYMLMEPLGINGEVCWKF